jgi:hypothetical protein
MALDPELARRVDPALSEIASRLDEASPLAADATLRLRALDS